MRQCLFKTVSFFAAFLLVGMSGCGSSGANENTTVQADADTQTKQRDTTELSAIVTTESKEEMPTAAKVKTTALEKSSFSVWDESVWQTGAAITPQPGDTARSWNPDLASNYPADRECTSSELLKKWMAVEGISVKDLDERECRQLVLAVGDENDGVKANISCYQKDKNGSWLPVDGLTGMSGWVGSGGVMHGRKRGSNTSPAGLWSLGLAFGNSKRPANLKMLWRDVTPKSDWVCDESSPYFNTWQERGDPNLSKVWSRDVEHLEDYPSAYAYACVIRFNTPPYTIPERGCAVFLHCSKDATGGCVGLPKNDIVNTLLWMRPEQNPYILITGKQLMKAVLR